MRRLAILLPLLWLATCGSPPVQDHILAAIPPAHATATPGHPLRVGDVAIPPDLDRNELVTQASATALKVHRQDVWGAPLGGMIQRTLSADLAARLGEGRVLAVDDPTSPSGTRTLTLSIRQFIAAPDGHVVLDADWTLQGHGAATSPHHATMTTNADSGKPDAVVQAMSEALAQLSDRIARDL